MIPDLLFSVVIPTYNRADRIVATIHAVLMQTYFHFEVIVVDDGSTDHTSVAIRPLLADHRVRYFNILNSERGAARNVGVSRSQGDYITFLDSDDQLLPWHLETAHTEINRSTNPPAFHLAYEIMQPDGQIDALPVLPSPVNKKLADGNFLSCLGVFLRRDVALAYRFDEDRRLSGSEDYELWLRIASTYPILAFPRVTARLVNHNARSVRAADPSRLITRIELLVGKMCAQPAFMDFFGIHVRKWIAFSYLYLSLHLVMAGDRSGGLNYLWQSVIRHPQVVADYRFLVVIKKLILG